MGEVRREGSRIVDADDPGLGLSDACSDRHVKLLLAESEDDDWSRMAKAALALRAAERTPVAKAGEAALARCSCKAFEESQ